MNALISKSSLHSWTMWLVMTALLFSLAPASQAKKKKKEKPQAPKPVTQGIDRSRIDTSKLVWPEPPDLPRIRYVKELFGETPKSIENKKKKQGWMDRMAGVEQRESGLPADLTHYLGAPYGIAIDSKNRIYVADTFVGAVFIFNVEDLSKVEFVRNRNEAKFKSIIGLAMDDNDRLFVSDAGLHHVLVFSPEHKLEAVFGDREMGRPSGMAIDTENRLLYVVDTDKETVLVYDADSLKLIRKIGGPAKNETDDDPGTLAKPTNVAVDEDGNVYVVDTLNNRIQIFDADGSFVSMFGKQGDKPGTFERPKGIGIDRDGHIWVADAAQNNVQIFDKQGHLLGFVGTGGTYPGQFMLPAGLAIDKNNRVVVSDQWRGRIQVFRYVTDAEHAADVAELEKKKQAAGNQAGERPAESTAAKQLSPADRLAAAAADAAAAKADVKK